MSYIVKFSTRSSIALSKKPVLPFWVFGDVGGKTGDMTIIYKSKPFVSCKTKDTVVLYDQDLCRKVTWVLHVVKDYTRSLFYYMVVDDFAAMLDINKTYSVPASFGLPTYVGDDDGPHLIDTKVADDCESLHKYLLSEQSFQTLLASGATPDKTGAVVMTNTCIICGYYNEFMDPIENYTCSQCRIRNEAWR